MKGLTVLLTGACGRIGKTFFHASKDRYRFTLTDRIAPDFDLGEHHFVHADLSAWLSPRNTVHLLQRSVEAEGVKHLIAHGISNNRFKRLDLSETTRVLGYHPLDDAFQTFDIPITD